MSSRQIETSITASNNGHPLSTEVQIAYAQIANLKPNLRNARTHSQRQVNQLVASIREFGWTAPIIVDEDNEIIAGHGRYLAARELALRQVPVVRVEGLNSTQKRALAIADNKIAANAGWDRKLLTQELGDLGSLLGEINLDLEITGFAPAEIDALMGDLVDPEQEPADEVPVIANKAISQPGDLWVLGTHQLLCGDVRDHAAWQALMGRQRAAMVFTDPPYNVRIHSVVGRGKTRHREFATASGEMTVQQFVAFLKSIAQQLVRYTIDGSIHYICMDWRHLRELHEAGSEVYSDLLNVIVWVKTNPGQGSFYRSQHELIFVFRNGDIPHRNNVELGRHGRNRSNVWTYPGVNTFRTGRMDDLALHPTVKPVAMVADAMRDCTRRGDSVLDPFMGSGTTILAAERVGRRAFGMEIDPLYVDVSIRRWQAFTGKDAVLEASGQTFDEISASRATSNRRRSK